MERRILFPLVLLLSLVACSPQESNTAESPTKKCNVLLFLNPDCPLCQSYSVTIRELQTEFSTILSWTAVFPGEWISRDSVNVFLNRYDLEFEEIIMDTELKLTKLYEATVTPSVYILDNQKTVLYAGRIDDWAITSGVKRLKPTDFNLRNALKELLAGKEVTMKKTTPIGCLIE